MNNNKSKKIMICIIIPILYLLISRGLAKLLLNTIGNISNEYLLYLIVYTIMSIILIAIIYMLDKIKILKFDKKSFADGLKIGGFLLLISSILLIGKVNTGIKSQKELLPTINIICYTVAILFGTGFTEEVLCRGIIQNVMYDIFGKDSRKGLILSIFFSAFIFGVMHYINCLLTNASFYTVSMQVLSAIGGGLYFGAIYARCKNLWVTIFLHGFLDFSQMLTSGFWGIGTSTSDIAEYDYSGFLALILFGLLAMFIIRKNKLTIE